ncbi:GNAT family N-acetyltransferase [Leifsonia sp. Root227]|uniref:GNAT family N-acetyltransferase n=1 Tax=Leifsonia sp. Root227 TaxID=1736496 RepID=UPI000B26A62E|nr:GNAT family N-acetyltransferase [Leifsonia sp. Root227]
MAVISRTPLVASTVSRDRSQRHAGLSPIGDWLLSRLPQLRPRRPRFMRGPRLKAPYRARRIQTHRLVLRPHRLADAEAWYRLQSEPTVLEYLSWPTRSRRQSRRHLHDRTRHTLLAQEDDFLVLAIERDGELIGDVSLHLRGIVSGDRHAEIGWVLSPACGGHGFATEAASVMLEIAFTRLDVQYVSAEMATGNTRSIKLARRLGFLTVRESNNRVVMVLSGSCRRVFHRDATSIDGTV